MIFHLLACGIFQPELDRVLEQIRAKGLFDGDIAVTYLPVGLHVDFGLLKEAVVKALDSLTGERVVLLYGARCHPQFDEWLQDYSLVRFEQANCIELILGERMKEIDHASRTFYLTTGWLLKWREIFDQVFGQDTVAARQSFGYNDRVLFLDAGVCEITDEQVLDFFEFTQVPVEIEQISLDVFQANLMAVLTRAMGNL